MAQRLGDEDGPSSAQLVPRGGLGCPRSCPGRTSNTLWWATAPPRVPGRLDPPQALPWEVKMPPAPPRGQPRPSWVWAAWEGPPETWLSRLP